MDVVNQDTAGSDCTPREVAPVVVHLGSTYTVHFGVLDANGDVIPQQPAEFQMQKFDAGLLMQAHDNAAEYREKIREAAGAAN